MPLRTWSFARRSLSFNSATDASSPSDSHPSGTIWTKKAREKFISITDPVELLFYFLSVPFLAANPRNQKSFHQTSFLHATEILARYD
jgi:hypothetical protein